MISSRDRSKDFYVRLFLIIHWMLVLVLIGFLTLGLGYLDWNSDGQRASRGCELYYREWRVSPENIWSLAEDL